MNKRTHFFNIVYILTKKILFYSFYRVIVTKSIIRIIAISFSPMTIRGTDEYHPYQQQIARWNEYQELLDKIDKKCSREAGVRLSRNVKHNVKTFTETTIGALVFFAMIALMSLAGSYMMNNIYGMSGSAIALGFIGWQSFIRLYHPSIINFRCSPVLHIDEFAYMRQAIKGIPAVEHDPIVRLPVLEMDIPRAWLGQQGMLKFMESLSDLKLEDDDGNKGETKRIP
jgi:hypothetical protein